MQLATHSDAMALAATCKTLHKDSKTLPDMVFKKWLSLALHINLNTHTKAPGKHTTWKQQFESIERAFRHIRRTIPEQKLLKSQKHLQYLQNDDQQVMADCPIVRRAITGLSLFPASVIDFFFDLDCDTRKIISEGFPSPRDDTERNYIREADLGRKSALTEYHDNLLKWMLVGRDNQGCNPCANEFEPARLEMLLDWIVQTKSEKKLRTILADCGLLQERGHLMLQRIPREGAHMKGDLLQSTARDLSALHNLVLIANGQTRRYAEYVLWA